MSGPGSGAAPLHGRELAGRLDRDGRAHDRGDGRGGAEHGHRQRGADRLRAQLDLRPRARGWAGARRAGHAPKGERARPPARRRRGTAEPRPGAARVVGHREERSGGRRRTEQSRAEQGDAVQAARRRDRGRRAARPGRPGAPRAPRRSRCSRRPRARRARGDGVPLDEGGGEDVGAGAAGGPMLRTVHERVLTTPARRHRGLRWARLRPGAVGAPGGAAGGRGAGCRLERTGRLSRRPASMTVTGP